ncbi:MAG: sel1 repeat family protein, partial [Opitutales bacterium]|nr:sel1 repeat family protein [Opitutales bacterium]
MKTLGKLFVCTSLCLAVSNVLTAQNDSPLEASAEELIERFARGDYGYTGVPEGAVTIETIQSQAEAGDAYAMKLWGDVLMSTAASSKEQKEARSFYKAAANKGVPSAALAYAKVLDQTEGEKKDGKVREHLLEASALGSAEADRLLAELYLKEGTLESIQQAWDLYCRAADREDVTSCLEVAAAYRSGLWQGMELNVDKGKSVHYYEVASSRQCAQAAYQLALLLSADGIDT